MLIRLIILLVLAGAVAYYFLRKRNIQIALSPLGRNALVVAWRHILRMILRRIGF